MIGEAYGKFVEAQLTALLRFAAQALESRGVPYSLVGGSMLGALRSGGLIPWDDDVDLVVRREDYDAARAAMRAACEESSYICGANGRVFCVRPRTDPVWEGKGIRGFGLDVFVADEVPSDEKGRRRLFFRLKVLQGMMKKEKTDWSRYGLKGKVLVFGTKVLGLFFSEKTLKKKYDKLSAKYAGCGSGLRCILNDVYALFETVYREAWMQQTEEVPFGDGTAKVYVGAHEMLVAAYGDYMTPPPEAERKYVHIPEY